jgi:hypothetical protein
VIKAETAPRSQYKKIWDDLLERDPVRYPLGSPADQSYCLAYKPDTRYEDISILVHDGDLPLAGLQLTSHSGPDGKTCLDFYGRPAYLRINGDIRNTTLEKAQKLLAEYLIGIVLDQTNISFDFLEMGEGGALSDFSVSLLKAGFCTTPYYTQILDLRDSVDSLKQGIRKSYKSLISWGDKNISPAIYNHENITADAFDAFHNLHLNAAGRETRPAESWAMQWEQIRSNEAFLVLGKLDNRPVSGALFITSPVYCYYGVGASDRALFDKPLSHAIIWAGILEAKEKGIRYFEMGELVHLYNAGYSEKERNISIFKNGFGGATRLMLKITNPR